MTHRERLTRTLLCQGTDRAPLPMWLGLAPWGQTLARWRGESGVADLNVQEYFGLDPFFRRFPCPGFGPWPHFEKTVLRQDGEFVVSIDYRGITLRDRRDAGSMPEWSWRLHPKNWRPRLAKRLRTRPTSMSGTSTAISVTTTKPTAKSNAI